MSFQLLISFHRLSAFFNRPYGTHDFIYDLPSTEVLGYSQSSLPGLFAPELQTFYIYLPFYIQHVVSPKGRAEIYCFHMEMRKRKDFPRDLFGILYYGYSLQFLTPV